MMHDFKYKVCFQVDIFASTAKDKLILILMV